MRYNITYLGPMNLAHMRRDFMLAMQYGLQALGHEVDQHYNRVNHDAVNLCVGAYFQPAKVLNELAKSGCAFINVNTEVLSLDGLNFNPDKCDMQGAYLPFIRRSMAAWDVILDNILQYPSLAQTEAKFLRWGYVPEMEEIDHSRKDLDFYFFGMKSKRRQEMIDALFAAGLKGDFDGECPTYVRNSKIGRAKVNLNIIQNDKYSHVNSFRICYLANNGAAVVSEVENDPACYLDGSVIAMRETFTDAVSAAAKDYAAIGERNRELFKRVSMKTCMEQLLDNADGK